MPSHRVYKMEGNQSVVPSHRVYKMEGNQSVVPSHLVYKMEENQSVGSRRSQDELNNGTAK